MLTGSLQEDYLTVSLTLLPALLRKTSSPWRMRSTVRTDFCITVEPPRHSPAHQVHVIGALWCDVDYVHQEINPNASRILHYPNGAAVVLDDSQLC